MLFVNPGCRWSSLLLAALVGLVLKPYPDLQAAALDITLCRHSNSWGCLGQVQSVPPINSKSTWSFISRWGWAELLAENLKILPNPSVSLHLPCEAVLQLHQNLLPQAFPATSHMWAESPTVVPSSTARPPTKKSKNQISLPFVRKVQSKKNLWFCGGDIRDF